MSFSKPLGLGLRQGALLRGPQMPVDSRKDEVEISTFSLSDKQRAVRDALAKRFVNLCQQGFVYLLDYFILKIFFTTQPFKYF